MKDSDNVVDSLLADPQARQRLSQALAADLKAADKDSFWQRARFFLAGASSALVVLLAFLIPSLQDQWDRYQTRAAVDRYAAIGEQLMQDGQYQSAEQAFTRAVELAGFQRNDLLENQIRSRVMRVYENEEWRGPVADDVTEADFAFLLQTETGPAFAAKRAATLAAYGAFLAGKKRFGDAETRLRESIQLDARNADAHLHLGNVYDDLKRPADAETEYRRAIALNPNDANTHYNLGLLLQDLQRFAEAETELRVALAKDPGNVEITKALADLGGKTRP
jgi:tetratricopeptide (TPR) repeat protein